MRSRPYVRGRLRGVVLLAVCVLVAAGGCGDSSPSVRLGVSPQASRMDERVALELSGLKPGSTVDLTVRSDDAGGVGWTSTATFAADGSGRVDPATTAPSSGSYLGTWAMGLLAAMTPSATAPGYRWPTTGAATFAVDATQNGATVATATFTRTLWTEPPTIRTFTRAADGFVGTYVVPAGVRRGPAVLVLGGSEGGDPAFSAMLLAARGIPALSVAYFKAPGLPAQLHDIPLEYFDTPLRWLRRQPEVDPDRLWISGGSRGSEAAALVATRRPQLVHGLLDLSPSSTVGCAFISTATRPCPGAAWLYDGRPVPFTRLVDNPAALDDTAAVIPVEKINGPVLTLCGGADLVWSSCAFSDAIQQRLAQQKSHFPRLALSYPDAGHAIDLATPYLPTAPPAPGALPTYGSTPGANDTARADAWPKLLDFVRQAH